MSLVLCLGAAGLRQSVASRGGKAPQNTKDYCTLRLVLYQPDIPQNTGAAIRVAACFGARLEIIEPCGFPLDARALRRSAMDYRLLTPPVTHADWDAFAKSLDDARLVLMTTQAEALLWDHDFSASDIILMGRESAGAPQAVHDRAAVRLKVPIAPEARSLNVAVAAAVTLAEARRQLGWSGATP